MKTIYLTLAAAVLSISMSYAQDALVSSGASKSVNVTKVSNNTPAPVSVENVSAAAEELPGRADSLSLNENTTTFTGRVNFVSLGNVMGGAAPQINIKDDTGFETIFVVASDAVITGKDGSPTGLNWIGQGDKVSVEYITDEHLVKVVRSIKVFSGW